MADAITTTTTASAIIPEQWSAKFFEVLLSRLPFIDSVDREYENEISDLGDIVNISSIGEFSEADLVDEDAVTDAEAANISGQQLVVNKRATKDFVVTKRAQLQSLEFMNKARDMAVYSLQKKMQSQIIAAIVPSASAPDHTISYDSGTTLGLADMLEGKELLDTQDVPAENRKQISGPAQWNDLFNVSGFTSKDFVPAGSPLSSGMFQTQLAGFDVDWTSVLTGTTYQFHPSFLNMAVQDQISIKEYDLGVQGKRMTRVNCDVLFGIKLTDDERVVSIS